MSRTTQQIINLFLAQLKPLETPLYQIPTAKDPLTGEMAQGIKFRGVIPIRDPKQPANMQPRELSSLPDSRIEPITSDRVATRVFRFTGDTKQYIYYLNMFPKGESWSMSLYFNLDNVSSSSEYRTIMQSASDVGNELNIGINSDSEIVVKINDQENKLPLIHNSGYLGMTYNASLTELTIQVNNTVLSPYKLTLNMTSAIFGLSMDRTNPFGPGYLGAIVLHTANYYNINQLSKLARYVREPEPPKPEEEEETKPLAEEQQTSESAAPPDIANELELQTVNTPQVVVDPVTGERVLVTEKTETNEEPTAMRFRQYNFQIPILNPPEPVNEVESFVVATAAHNKKSPPVVNSVTPGHLKYRPY